MKNKFGLTLLLFLVPLVLNGCSNQGQAGKAKPVTSQPTENVLKPKKEPVQVLSPAQIKENKRKKELKAKHEKKLKIQEEKKRAEWQRIKTIKNSAAYRLAAFDNGKVSVDSRSVKRFRSLISQLERKFSEGQDQMANMTIRAHQLLAEDGISESCEGIMGAINQTLSRRLLDKNGTNHQKYAEYIALYVVDRKAGLSSEEIIEGMRELTSGGEE